MSRVVWAPLAIVVGLLAHSPPAAAYCRMTSSDARPSLEEPCVLASLHPGSHELAWTHRCTSFSISSALPPPAGSGVTEAQLRDVLALSIAHWTTADCMPGTTGLDVTILAEENACTHAAHYRNGRNVHSIVFVATPMGDTPGEEWTMRRMHDPRALAVTYVWHDPSTGEILDADMELNEDLKDFHVCTTTDCAELHGGAGPDSADADLENTLTHEFGHYFGLAHTPDDDEATMFAEANGGETRKRDLRPDDVNGICAIYPPGTLPEACDPTPAGGLGLDCLPPSGCGCRAPGTRGREAASGLALLGLALATAFVRRGR